MECLFFERLSFILFPLLIFPFKVILTFSIIYFFIFYTFFIFSLNFLTYAYSLRHELILSLIKPPKYFQGSGRDVATPIGAGKKVRGKGERERERITEKKERKENEKGGASEGGCCCSLSNLLVL